MKNSSGSFHIRSWFFAAFSILLVNFNTTARAADEPVPVAPAASPAAAMDDAAKADLAKMQGKWVPVQFLKGGQSAPAELLPQLAFTFDADQLSVTGNKASATMKLDASKTPKTFDTTDNDTKKLELGIYEVDGDTLKLCIGELGKARPTEFISTKDNGTVYIVLKRAAKEAK